MRPLVTPSAIRLMAARGSPIVDLSGRSVDRHFEQKPERGLVRSIFGRLQSWQRVGRLVRRPGDHPGNVVEPSSAEIG